MKIAIPVMHGLVGGPGESEEIIILDSENGYSRVETYENPALTAVSARGISMLKSVLDRDVEVLVVGHIGEHAFSYARNRLKLYSATGMHVEEAIEEFKSGKLHELNEPHHGSHSHNH